MKKWFYIFLLMLIYSSFAKADVPLVSGSSFNTSQQTGGNYIYAENGKLTFNFEPSVFQNRQWQYNSSIDGAVTAFELNQMPIKTKHSSKFYGYEIAQNGQWHLVAYYDESEKAHSPMMKPVYKKGYEGRTVHVWLPQAAGWVVRVVGKVARAIVPPIVTNAAKLCVKNEKCASLVIGNLAAGGLMCSINYYSNDGILKVFKRVFDLPKGVCSKAEEDGWTKDENGQYVRNVNYPYYATIKYGDHTNEYLSELSEQAMPSETIGAKSMEELENKIRDKCYANQGKKFNELDYPDELAEGDDSGTVTTVNFTRVTYGFSCSVLFTDELDDHDGTGTELHAIPISFQAYYGSGELVKKETLQFVDLENYVSEDFKDNPNPYINDTGQVGKEIREKIESSSSIMKKDGSTGTLNLSSDPYKNPTTGETMQDVLSIKSGTSWEIPPNSGGTGSSGVGGSGGGGSGGDGSGNVPQGKNDVTVTSIARPDQSENAKPAENNSANGTGASVSVGIGGGGNTSGNGSGSGNGQGGTGSGNGNSSGNQAASGANQAGLNCDGEHKGTLACASLGNVADGAFDDIKIPIKTDTTGYQHDGFLPSSGVCPAPKTFHVVGKQFQISYEPLCNFVSQIRFAVLIGFAITAAFIAFGGLKKN